MLHHTIAGEFLETSFLFVNKPCLYLIHAMFADTRWSWLPLNTERAQTKKSAEIFFYGKAYIRRLNQTLLRIPQYFRVKGREWACRWEINKMETRILSWREKKVAGRRREIWLSIISCCYIQLQRMKMCVYSHCTGLCGMGEKPLWAKVDK